MSNIKVLLIDIGSSSIKWTTSSNGFKIERTFKIPFPKPLKETANFFEVDIEKIWKIIKVIIENNKDVKQLFISTQMHGYLLADNNYNLLTPYISWRDNRSKGVIEPFKVDSSRGVSYKTNLPMASIKSMYKRNPELMNQVSHFFTLGSYICYKLTKKNVTHITDAAPTGYYSILDDYQEKLTFNLPVSKKEVEIVGSYEGIKVFTPVGDQQASILGIDKNYDGYILNLGTAAQLCVINDEFIEGNFETRPYFNNKYLCTVTGLIGGAKIKLNNDKLKLDMISQYQEALNKLPKRNKLVVLGGVLKSHKKLIENVLKKLKVTYYLDDTSSALGGLNKLAKKVNEMKKRQCGMMISEVSFSNLPLLVKQQGMDFIIIDYEHGGFDYKDIASMIMNGRLSKIEVYVRLANNDRKDIQKILDMGADGLILPMTNTADDIDKVIKYAKYRPLGKRGISTMRAHSLYNPSNLLEYLKSENKRVKVFAQIETILGLKNIDSIVSIPEIEGVFLGPNDLSDDYQCLDDNNAKQIHNAITLISAACKKEGKKSGIITTNKNYINTAKNESFDYYSVGSELSFLKQGAKDTIKLIIE